MNRRDDCDSLKRSDAQQVSINGDDGGGNALVRTCQHGVVIEILGDHPDVELAWGHVALTVESGHKCEVLFRSPLMVFPDLLLP